MTSDEKAAYHERRNEALRNAVPTPASSLAAEREERRHREIEEAYRRGVEAGRRDADDGKWIVPVVCAVCAMIVLVTVITAIHLTTARLSHERDAAVRAACTTQDSVACALAVTGRR